MKKQYLILSALLASVTSAFAQIGSVDKDLVFTPITPCRIVDTRTAGGVVLAGSTRIFKAWAATYAAQGGSTTNCGLLQTNDVAALALNLVVVTPSADGYITAYPVGIARPTASTLNYKTNDIIANSATLKVNQTTSDWNLYSLATAHFIADVVGYYSKPVATALECLAVSDAVTTVAASVLLSSVTAPSCDAGYSKTATSCSFYGNQLVLRKTETSSDVTGAASFCFYDNPAATAQTVFITSTCCRIPGR